MVYPLHSGYSVCVCACVCVFASANVSQRGVKQSMQPSLTAVGQPSHVTAGDQCQTGKVTGLRTALSPSLQSLKNPADSQAKFDSVRQIICLSRRHGAVLRFGS